MLQAGMKHANFLTRCTAYGADNLKVLRNVENSGVSYSLNKAADNATGDLYAPVDHDDMVVTRMVRADDAVPVPITAVIGLIRMSRQITYKGFPQLHMYKP